MDSFSDDSLRTTLSSLDFGTTSEDLELSTDTSTPAKPVFLSTNGSGVAPVPLLPVSSTPVKSAVPLEETFPPAGSPLPNFEASSAKAKVRREYIDQISPYFPQNLNTASPKLKWSLFESQQLEIPLDICRKRRLGISEENTLNTKRVCLLSDRTMSNPTSQRQLKYFPHAIHTCRFTRDTGYTRARHSTRNTSNTKKYRLARNPSYTKACRQTKNTSYTRACLSTTNGSYLKACSSTTNTSYAETYGSQTCATGTDTGIVFFLHVDLSQMSAEHSLVNTDKCHLIEKRPQNVRKVLSLRLKRYVQKKLKKYT